MCLKSIEAEDWKKATGIKYHPDETNSALAERDYSVKCYLPHLICKIKGYHLWWCTTHHQPYAICQVEK